METFVNSLMAAAASIGTVTEVGEWAVEDIYEAEIDLGSGWQPLPLPVSKPCAREVLRGARAARLWRETLVNGEGQGRWLCSVAEFV